jgi:uncharacterized protein YecE (DUF72 family)
MQPPETTPATYVGMGGWDLPPFSGVFYPPRPPRGFRKLRYYSRFFDFVEINSTFYQSTLGRERGLQWLRDVEENDRFIFTVKLFQGFTHSYRATMDDVRGVRELLDVLEGAGRLRGLLIQFPSSFVNRADARSYVARLGKAFRDHRIFLEVRHRSWNTPLVHQFCRENTMHLVNVDLPPIRQHMPLTALGWDGHAYFRMMGRNALTWGHPEAGERYDYLYSDGELERLAQWVDYMRRTVGTVFVVFHNDPQAQSLYNGFRLRRLLLQNARPPEALAMRYPGLRQAAEPAGMLSLFA